MQRDSDEAGRSIGQRFRSKAYRIAGNCVAAQSGARCEECHRCKREDSQAFSDCGGKHENSVRQKDSFIRSKIAIYLVCGASPKEIRLDAVIF
jgi:hypothetical protein